MFRNLVIFYQRMIEDKYQLDRSSNLEYLEKLTFKLCKIEKPNTEFLWFRQRNRKDGYAKRIHMNCKLCFAKRKKEAKKIQNQYNQLKPSDNPKDKILCPCCHRLPIPGSNGKIRWNFDHDRRTGTARGWICRQCNIGLGSLGDNWQGMFAALIWTLKVEKNKTINQTLEMLKDQLK